MASIRALAAIGLMMVIVVPIGLGYALAIDEGETTAWQTVDRANISDLILNSSTAYTIGYGGPANNSQLILTKHSQAGTVTEIGAPQYVEVGSVYTSIPQYISTTGTKVLDPSDRFTYPLNNSSIGIGDYALKLTGDYLYIAIDSATTSAHWQLDYGYRFTYTKEPTLAIRDGQGTYTLYNTAIPGGSATGIETFGITTDTTGTVTVAKSPYTVMGIQGTYTFALQSYGLKLSLQGGGTEYIAHSGGISNVTVSSMGTVTAEGRTVEGVSSVAVATSAGAGTIGYTTVTPSGLYASPGEGWDVPSDAVTVDWTNGAINDRVTMYATIDKGNTAAFAKMSDGSVGPALEIRNNGGMLSVGGTDLGSYPSVKIVIDRDGYSVSGIESWPSLGGYVEGYNSIKVEAPSGYFDRIRLGGDHATYRVDGADVIAGYFASTKDYTLDLESLYPGKSVLIELTGIGVYGDSLRIGSVTYAVEDGRITEDGRSFAVKGLKVGILDTDGGHLITFNGTEVRTEEDPPSVFFGGEWSMGAVLYTMEETTVKTMSWVPGVFAFDKEAIAAAGLICCGLAFLALGLTGKAGGPKVALLGLVLGGAATVYLIIL